MVCWNLQAFIVKFDFNQSSFDALLQSLVCVFHKPKQRHSVQLEVKLQHRTNHSPVKERMGRKPQYHQHQKKF